MDLLFKRYASPFLFMNGMIQTGRFSDFVIDFVKTINEEKADKHSWEFYLHKVWEGSFADFKKDMEINENDRNLPERTIETTIQHTQNILNNFNPEKQGGE